MECDSREVTLSTLRLKLNRECVIKGDSDTCGSICEPSVNNNQDLWTILWTAFWTDNMSMVNYCNGEGILPHTFVIRKQPKRKMENGHHWIEHKSGNNGNRTIKKKTTTKTIKAIQSNRNIIPNLSKA